MKFINTLAIMAMTVTVAMAKADEKAKITEDVHKLTTSEANI